MFDSIDLRMSYHVPYCIVLSKVQLNNVSGEQSHEKRSFRQPQNSSGIK